MRGSEQIVRKYYFAGSSRIALRENGTLTWLLSDHLGGTTVTEGQREFAQHLALHGLWRGTRRFWRHSNGLPLHRAVGTGKAEGN